MRYSKIHMSESRVKRLIHRANYRGFREADLILGGFARAHANNLSEKELSEFETLLLEKDHDVYDWVSGTQQVPAKFNTPLFAKICAFKP